ncbi:MAG: mechanosensitive ion channel [Planctomycetota bacterium]|nr:MAG: mechanosensitive ion channel [Planctomycetota bacterium]
MEAFFWEWSPVILMAILSFILFLTLSEIAFRLIQRSFKSRDIDDHVTSLVARTARIILVIIGIVTALGTLKVNVTALVASLGLTGFALGFALKDTVSNLLAGVLIFLYKPFLINDRIKLGGFEGVVEKINLRYTELSNDGDKILIPNSKLFTDPIVVRKKEDTPAEEE